MDVKNLHAKRVAVVTDETVDKLDAMRHGPRGAHEEGLDFRVFNKTRIEPKDYS